MKRGFLNRKKAQREALPPAEAVKNQILAPSAAQAIASHYKSGGEFGAFFILL